MSFASAAGLLWLIPLAGIIIVLYLLKMRRKDLRVPATFLWPAMTYEIRANALFQKLKFSWLMVLQLIALCLVVLALARPQLRQRGLGGEVTVVVLDSSASMSATDVKPSRFGQAARVARDIVDGVRPGDRVSLVEAGPTPRVVFPLSNDPAKMRRALDTVVPTDGEANVGEAMRLASSIAAKHGSARIILLSDGVFPEIENFSPGKAKVIFNKIGSSRKNVALTAVGVTDTARGRELYVGMKNYFADAQQGILNVYADGKMVNSVKVQIKGRGTEGSTMAAPPGARVFEAKLDLDDDLAADNYAVGVNDPGATIRTLLVTRGNLFLERALSLDPRITLDRATSVPAKTDYDLVVFDGIKEVPVAAKAVITFGAAGADSPVRRTGTVTKPTVRTVDEQHPLMTGIDLDNTYIDSAEKVEVKNEGEVVATSSAGPLIVASKGRQRRIYVSFEPMNSDFPLQVGFPIFLSNALDYLIPPQSRAGAISVAAGRAFSMPALGEAKPITVSGPKGKSLVEAAGGVYVVRDIRTVGKYTVDNGGQVRPIYASLVSETESNIEPTERVMMGGSAVAAAESVLRLEDYWRPLLLLGLMVLAGEWWLFARRS